MQKIKKRPVGKPRKFNSVKELEKKINKYFEKCDSNTIEVWNKKTEEKEVIAKPIPYTIEGLCVLLEIDRKTLLNYSRKDEYFHTIQKAKQKVHEKQVEMAITGQTRENITIFLLKNNANYADKSEVKQDINANVSLKVVWE